MGAKTTEHFMVICEGLFLNNEKPAEWTQSFAWKPSVGFHFKYLDESGEPTGDLQKKYLNHNKIWMFQAMGGQNAKGHYFRIEAESGTMPAKENQPEKPYVTITPMAEVFKNEHGQFDGSARFLEAPKDGKVNTPAPAKTNGAPAGTGGKPAGTPPTAKTNPPAETKTTTTATTTETKAVKEVDPNTAKAKQFFDELQNPKSDSWWLMKTQLGFDCAEASNILDWAKHMALMEFSKVNRPDLDFNDLRVEVMAAIDFWTGALRPKLLAMKFSNMRLRLSHYLTLCSSVDQIDKVLYKAWTELPESDFLALRTEAVARVGVIKSQCEGQVLSGAFKGKIIGTLQPEVAYVPSTPEPEPGVEEEEALFQPEEPAPQEKASGIPAEEIAWMVKGIHGYTDIKKLLNFWTNTKPELLAVEEVRQAMRLWITNIFMASKYQANVDGLREQFPQYLMTPELEKILHARYAEMAKF